MNILENAILTYVSLRVHQVTPEIALTYEAIVRYDVPGVKILF